MVSYLIVVTSLQTATCFYGDTASAFEHKAWLTETRADTGASAVGGGFLTAGDAGRATLYILSIGRARHYWGREGEEDGGRQRREGKGVRQNGDKGLISGIIGLPIN